MSKRVTQTADCYRKITVLIVIFAVSCITKPLPRKKMQSKKPNSTEAAGLAAAEKAEDNHIKIKTLDESLAGFMQRDMVTEKNIESAFIYKAEHMEIIPKCPFIQDAS